VSVRKDAGHGDLFRRSIRCPSAQIYRQVIEAVRKPEMNDLLRYFSGQTLSLVGAYTIADDGGATFDRCTV
jgi:hypothetical protein